MHNGTIVVAQRGDNEVRVWSVDGYPILRIPAVSASALAFDPTGRILAFSNGADEVAIWCIAGREPVKLSQHRVEGSSAGRIVASPDGKHFAVSGSKSVHVLTASGGSSIV